MNSLTIIEDKANDDPQETAMPFLPVDAEFDAGKTASKSGYKPYGTGVTMPSNNQNEGGLYNKAKGMFTSQSSSSQPKKMSDESQVLKDALITPETDMPNQSSAGTSQQINSASSQN